MNAKTITDTQTDWKKLARRNDNEIDYSDAPPMPTEPLQLRIRYPNGKILPINTSAIEIDAEILMWFKTHQKNYQETINELLRDLCCNMNTIYHAKLPAFKRHRTITTRSAATNRSVYYFYETTSLI